MAVAFTARWAVSLWSAVTFAKLQELMTGRPLVFPGAQYVSAMVLMAAVVLVVAVAGTETYFGSVTAAPDCFSACCSCYRSGS